MSNATGLRAGQLGTTEDDGHDGLAAQVAARTRASAEDAEAQAPNRMAAAAKAVALLRAAAEGDDRGTVDQAAHPGTAVAAAAPVAPAGQAPARPVVPTGGPAAVVGTVFASSAREQAAAGTPLLEVRPSALSGDVEQLGDTLLVYVDRLEHRDRHGRLKRRMPMRDVAGAEVQRRLTGATLVVVSHAGVDLVLKGVRTEAAEQARQVIVDQRPTGPAAGSPVRPAFDEAGLLRKLVDLYRAGVLGEDELAAKTDVVARLAREAAQAAAGGGTAQG